MAEALTGLSALSGINALAEDTPEATAEERMGGPANPYHGHWGEQAAPYPWESSLAVGGSHGPYGPENQLLGDDMWFIEPPGMPGEDPEFDYNMPSVTKSHGSVHNTFPKTVPSMHEAIGHQVDQMDNHASDLGTSRGMTHYQEGEAQQDRWEEIWNPTPGESMLQKAPGQIVVASGGYGTTDRTQSLAGQNGYEFDTAHFHRRFAAGSIPGNYMWMKPGGRPMFKTLPGPARPATGMDSPFYGQDVGAAFGTQGAILADLPSEYQAPPVPTVGPPLPSDEGSPGIELY